MKKIDKLNIAIQQLWDAGGIDIDATDEPEIRIIREGIDYGYISTTYI